jgi:hypothetical protein
VIHRQRLVHERRQADLAAVRATLARGAELGNDLYVASIRWDPHHPVERAPAAADYAALAEAAVAWQTWNASLGLLFPKGHTVVRAANDVEASAFVMLEKIRARLDDKALWESVREITTRLQEWKTAARDVAHAKLGRVTIHRMPRGRLATGIARRRAMHRRARRRRRSRT